MRRREESNDGTLQNRLNIRLGIEAELSESMGETLRRWSLRQLSTAGAHRDRMEAAIINNDPDEMRSVIAPFSMRIRDRSKAKSRSCGAPNLLRISGSSPRVRFRATPEHSKPRPAAVVVGIN